MYSINYCWNLLIIAITEFEPNRRNRVDIDKVNTKTIFFMIQIGFSKILFAYSDMNRNIIELLTSNLFVINWSYDRSSSSWVFEFLFHFCPDEGSIGVRCHFVNGISILLATKENDSIFSGWSHHWTIGTCIR